MIREDEKLESALSVVVSEQAEVHSLSATPWHMWRADPDGVLLAAGLPTLAYLGADAATMQEKWASAIHPEDLPDLLFSWNRSRRSGAPFYHEYRWRKWDGTYRWFRFFGFARLGTSGEVICWEGSADEIADEGHKKESQEPTEFQVVGTASQAGRISEFAASIAHEINQPLTAILASADALSSWLSKQPPNIDRAMRLANNISRDAASASGTINSIRALFRGIKGAGQSLDINRIVQEFANAMRDEFRQRGIDVRLHFALHLPPAIADEAQLRQVLSNLVRNAVEAMTALEGSPRQIEICTRFDGNEVRVDVVDSGRGMADTDRVFDPFHSTKRDGMGMGLAICRSIVEAYSGRLWVDATGPEGTRMSFALPAVPSS